MNHMLAKMLTKAPSGAINLSAPRRLLPMADSLVLDRALARRKRLIRDLERVPTYQELTRLDAFIETYREFEGGDLTTATNVVERPTTPSRGRRRESLPDVAFTILSSCSAPLPVGELASILKERARPVGGKNPNINLSSILSRDPRFETVPGRGWRLKREKPNAIDEAPNETGAHATTEASETVSAAPERPKR